MKYGKIMPHCMAKELPVCSNVTSVVDFLRKATNFIFSAFMIKHTLQVEPILKVNFFAVSVGEQVCILVDPKKFSLEADPFFD